MACSRRRFAAAVVLVLTAGGCDTLLGLGHFSDVPCAYDCPDASPDVTVVPDAGGEADAGSMPDAGDAGVEADVQEAATLPDALDDLSAPEAASPNQVWAHWPMPNPDASIAPDSSTLLPNQMAYDAATDGSVFDIVTNLTWEVGSAAQPAADYAHAWMHCQSIGMRLPTRIELVSLVDFTRSPSIDITVFPDAQLARFWTSSVVWADPGSEAGVQYWSVDFSDGLVGTLPAIYVRCVAGGAQ